MGRPRIRRLYRATDTGYYDDGETGVEFFYVYGRIYPDIEVEKNPPYISRAVQEKLCRKLVEFGKFELADDYPDEIERVGGETTVSE